MNLQDKIANIPLGASEKRMNDKKYLVTRKDFNGGKSTKVFAQELGGNDFISFNFYLTNQGQQLRPCEMPKQKVLDFINLYGD